MFRPDDPQPKNAAGNDQDRRSFREYCLISLFCVLLNSIFSRLHFPVIGASI
jgi:hypothetical protein